ncbi:CD1871A family CXXC motif-containing protein [Romboutsia maritimum]|nr:CD1871A family CXXC motif-containing protein [Romboutsia maritimum]
MKVRLLRGIVLFMSICFIVGGVYRNEVKIVLNKATNICLECIGIG